MKFVAYTLESVDIDRGFDLIPEHSDIPMVSIMKNKDGETLIMYPEDWRIVYDEENFN